MQLGSALNTLAARLVIDSEGAVRAALCEAIGRLPYTDTTQIALAEATLVGAAERADTVIDQLGVAKGLEALIRMNVSRRPPGGAALATLRRLFGVPGTITADASAAQAPKADTDPMHSARVRRLAFQGLLDAGDVSDVVERAAIDPDPQVRRLAMLGVSSLDRQESDRSGSSILQTGLSDPASMVRIEALRGESLLGAGGREACALAVDAAQDPEIHVSLAGSTSWPRAGRLRRGALSRTCVDDVTALVSPRGWHRKAHAFVALAGAAPDMRAPASTSSPARRSGRCDSMPPGQPSS